MEKKHYFLTMDGEVRGPYSLAQLRSMWAAGTITARTTFREHETDAWLPIDGMDGLLGLERSSPPNIKPRVVVRTVPKAALLPPPLPQAVGLPPIVALSDPKPKLGALRLCARIILFILWPPIWLFASALARVFTKVYSEEYRKKAIGSWPEGGASAMTAHEYASSVARVEAILAPLSLIVLALGFVAIWLITRRRVKATPL